MQVVILAAGRGTRMGHLTESTPKPLLKVGGKTLLELKFDILPPEVDEIILIVGYLGDAIRKYFGDEYRGKKITYIQQDVLNGTAGSLWLAKDILRNSFLVMMGDDLYCAEDIVACFAHEWAQVVQKTVGAFSGGNVELDESKHILNIVEGEHPESGIIGTSLYLLDTRLFEYPMVPKSLGSEEFGLPQTVLAASKAAGISFVAVPATLWIQITSPEDLKKAEERLKS